MEKIKGRFGFGAMRLPMEKKKVDLEETRRMVDAFMAKGLNYFDTAHGYLGEQSEPALREALTSRYPRESYFLTDKLSGEFYHKQEDIRPLIEKQLELCGVDSFDMVLLHAITEQEFAKVKRCNAWTVLKELRQEGKIRHLGFSFHDKAEVLEKVLSEFPDAEAVQIQLNYLDAQDAAVQSELVRQVCVRHGKPVIVMEPCKGGSLAKLPPDAEAALSPLENVDQPGLALRWAAGREGVMMVLSGMSNLEQMESNLRSMADPAPLTEEEEAAVERVADAFHRMGGIACTGCRYCISGCPMHIHIPDLFACKNSRDLFHNWNSDWYYTMNTKAGGKASDCIRCGKCEAACPQHLPIRDLLAGLAAEYEKKKG